MSTNNPLVCIIENPRAVTNTRGTYRSGGKGTLDSQVSICTANLQATLSYTHIPGEGDRRLTPLPRGDLQIIPHEYFGPNQPLTVSNSLRTDVWAEAMRQSMLFNAERPCLLLWDMGQIVLSYISRLVSVGFIVHRASIDPCSHFLLVSSHRWSDNDTYRLLEGLNC